MTRPIIIVKKTIILRANSIIYSLSQPKYINKCFRTTIPQIILTLSSSIKRNHTNNSQNTELNNLSNIHLITINKNLECLTKNDDKMMAL